MIIALTVHLLKANNLIDLLAIEEYIIKAIIQVKDMANKEVMAY